MHPAEYSFYKGTFIHKKTVKLLMIDIDVTDSYLYFQHLNVTHVTFVLHSLKHKDFRKHFTFSFEFNCAQKIYASILKIICCFI
jgi:hypothetical protein